MIFVRTSSVSKFQKPLGIHYISNNLAHNLKNLDLQTIEWITTTRTIKTRNKLCYPNSKAARVAKYSLRLVVKSQEEKIRLRLKLTQNFDTLEGGDPILNLP
jgi:hypothetical protein